VGDHRVATRGDQPRRLLPEALREALERLLGDSAARAALEERAAAAAAGPYSWDEIARRTLALYEELR